MVRGIIFTPFLIVFVAALPLPLIYAAEGSTIEANSLEVKPKIDGKFTSESEWSDASVTNFQSNGYDFYLLSKQDRNYVYLMLDGVDFQTDPKRTDISVRYQSTICFDVNNDKGSKRQPDDFCFTHTVNNEFGKWIMSQNAPKKFDSEGNPSHLDLPSWSFRVGWGFGSQNNQFESSDHLMYEIRVPKKMLKSEGDIGFTFEMYFDSAHDELVQLVDGVVWPSESDKEKPSTWGTLFLPHVECQKGLGLIFKASDGSPACVKPETKEKLIERGWAESDSKRTHLTPIIPELGKIGTYELQKGNKTYDIPYHIKGGSDIKEIFLDENSKTLNVVLKQYDSGSLEITLPRELIDAKISEDIDDLFFVLIDGKEVPYDETTSETLRTLTIPFEKESEIIEIIGVMPI